MRASTSAAAALSRAEVNSALVITRNRCGAVESAVAAASNIHRMRPNAPFRSKPAQRSAISRSHLRTNSLQSRRAGWLTIELGLKAKRNPSATARRHQSTSSETPFLNGPTAFATDRFTIKFAVAEKFLRSTYSCCRKAKTLSKASTGEGLRSFSTVTLIAPPARSAAASPSRPRSSQSGAATQSASMKAIAQPHAYLIASLRAHAAPRSSALRKTVLGWRRRRFSTPPGVPLSATRIS